MARRDKIIAEDPTDGVTLPRKRRAEVAMTLPTPEDFGKTITAAGLSIRLFIGLCEFAGLRLGEGAAVQLGDVDFLRGTLNVSRQVQRSDCGEVEFRGPKYGSERVVYIPDGLVTMIAEHVETGGVRPGGWLFRGAKAPPPHQNTVGYW